MLTGPPPPRSARRLCTAGAAGGSVRGARPTDPAPAATPVPANADDSAFPTTNGSLNRKLRMALVGGGSGSFIGRVHATAAVLDNRAEIVAGALSSNPERAKKSAPSYAIPEDRAYTSIHELVEKELARPEDDRVDFVSVATPNHTHFEIAKTAAEAGFNVVCDKPMTFDYAQAEELVKVVENTPGVFALMHNYTGYPLIRQARTMCLGGELGEVQAVRSNYIQGWLRDAIEADDQKQASWRTDPSKSGAAGAFGDIATHAYNLGRFMTGLLPDELACNLKSFVEGRRLDDYGHAVVRYDNGALGTVTASQISHGRENDLYIQIDGTKKSLVWRQENPNELFVRENGKAMRVYTRDPNAPYLSDLARESCRLPSGHPEGFFECFANVYRAAYDAMTARAEGTSFEGRTDTARDTLYPNVYDGAEGMLFVTKSVESSEQNGAWVSLKNDYARR